MLTIIRLVGAAGLRHAGHGHPAVHHPPHLPPRHLNYLRRAT